MGRDRTRRASGDDGSGDVLEVLRPERRPIRVVSRRQTMDVALAVDDRGIYETMSSDKARELAVALWLSADRVDGVPGFLGPLWIGSKVQDGRTPASELGGIYGALVRESDDGRVTIAVEGAVGFEDKLLCYRQELTLDDYQLREVARWGVHVLALRECGCCGARTGKPCDADCDARGGA